MTSSLTQLLEEQTLPHCPRLRHAPLPCMRSEFSVSGNAPNLPFSMSPDTSQSEPPKYCGLNNALDFRAATSPEMHPRALALTLAPRSTSLPIMSNELAPTAHLSPESHSPSAHTFSHSQSGVAYSIRRVEHKIRGINQVMHWFDSHGCEPLLTPPPCGPLECGDIYLHQSLSTPNTRQMWIWSVQQGWEDARENQVHPLLPMHRLWLGANKEPRWVTQKTIRTYKGRLKVLGKLKVGAAPAESEAFFLH
ncbi:uncharacterized protein F5891DRAFT_1183791 [Suillus fuscotomentosus]|uniref:Uncharacterized protein n=1 Tax=Suillus fuscotomentosus TaxID=1912939 RepID=A0AAD4HPA3_9AGAM|nr:uncharacterized protein F5891DRAFT_1183791 [Suillus fuscotomentosus]KAG1905085.1 hypothetical protein F5891DRAFT_1183791 [Suillus fuscotomentosus]